MDFSDTTLRYYVSKVVFTFFLGCYESAQKSNQDGFGS